MDAAPFDDELTDEDNAVLDRARRLGYIDSSRVTYLDCCALRDVWLHYCRRRGLPLIAFGKTVSGDAALLFDVRFLDRRLLRADVRRIWGTIGRRRCHETTTDAAVFWAEIPNDQVEAIAFRLAELGIEPIDFVEPAEGEFERPAEWAPGASDEDSPAH